MPVTGRNQNMSKKKKKSFIVMLGASAVGAYSLIKSPWEIFRAKIASEDKKIKAKSSVKFVENPNSIKRKNNS